MLFIEAWEPYIAWNDRWMRRDLEIFVIKVNMLEKD